MAKIKDVDAKTLELIETVRRQKAEIAEIEKPAWHTNATFSWTEEDRSKTINLHVESDVRKLILIADFLLRKEAGYLTAAVALDIESVPGLLWCGFPVKDWIEDIRLRVRKIQIGKKKEKLALLEGRLDAILSPELRRELELEAIAAELG